jgi:hypothetical protein
MIRFKSGYWTFKIENQEFRLGNKIKNEQAQIEKIAYLILAKRILEIQNEK